ncbi:hypothetical protein FBU31_002944, partial [Coemansia sp. 'formosensis']
MSDIEEYGQKDRRGRRTSFGSDDDSDGYDTRRARYSDDDEEEEEEEEDDDELRREGFLVDDDEEEEKEERRRKKKKKRRHHASSRTQDELDELDEEDLALVAENTNQEEVVATKFKRLKRGRASHGDQGSELRAELDDLMDTGEAAAAAATGDLGLFDDGAEESDISERDYRSSRRMGRSSKEEEEEDSDGLVNDPLDAPRHRRRPAQDQTRDRVDAGARSRQAEGGGGGAASAAGLVFDSLESIDDETWMELQDIFGDGEEYAFAMEASQARPEAYERTLADV